MSITATPSSKNLAAIDVAGLIDALRAPEPQAEPIDLSKLTDIEELPAPPTPRASAADGTGDNRIGSFQQGQINDCWFAAALAAGAQDADGAKLLSQSIDYDAAAGAWHVTFAGDSTQTDFTVTQAELSAWPGIRGDTDAAVIEIAAAKYFDKTAPIALKQWAGQDPVKQLAVAALSKTADTARGIQSAIFEIYQKGEWSPSLVADYETARTAAQKAIDRISSLDQNRSVIPYFARMTAFGLDGSTESIATTLLTNTRPQYSFPKTAEELTRFLESMSQDPDGTSITLGSNTDPRTGQPWYANRPRDDSTPHNPIAATPFATYRIDPDSSQISGVSGHAVSITAVDADAKTLSFRDPNLPDQAFTLSWDDFGKWYLSQNQDPQFKDAAVLTSTEIPQA